MVPGQTFISEHPAFKYHLEWNGEDKPKVSCHMWIKHEDGKFDVQRMSIERTDRYGHSMKKIGTDKPYNGVGSDRKGSPCKSSRYT